MKETIKVYLCGGMSGLSFDDQNNWRVEMDHLLKLYCEKSEEYKIKTYNPCDYFNFEEVKYKSEEEVMDFDLFLVNKSDIVVVNFNKPDSIGSAIEIYQAYLDKKPVIGICKEHEYIHPWIERCVNRMFDNSHDLAEYIRDFYCK